MYLTVLKDKEQIYPESGKITLPRNDKELETYTFETDASAGSMIYAVASCDDARAGVLLLSVTYLSRTDEKEKTPSDPRLERVYEVDYSSKNWGNRDNNGWSFQFFDKINQKFKNLAYVTKKSQYTGITEDTRYQHMLIGTYGVTHPSLYGNPALVFTAPYTGTIDLALQERLGAPDASDGTNITVQRNGRTIQAACASTAKMSCSVLSVPLVKGDQVEIMLDCGTDVAYDTTIVRAYAEYSSVAPLQPVGQSPETGEKNIPFYMMTLAALSASVLLFHAVKVKR